MAKSRFWCFTLNNPAEDDVPSKLDHQTDYYVVGNEVGQNGTPHLQGYCEFKRRYTLSSLQRIYFNGKAHWEIRKGTGAQAATYCKKDGKFVEVGTMAPEVGRAGADATKRKFDDAWGLARAGKIEEIDSELRIRYYSTLKRIEKDYMVKPADLQECTGVWIVGESGCGKSHLVISQFPDAYRKMRNEWWDGYQGEEVVLLDDLDKFHRSLGSSIKDWTGQNAFVGQVKGGAICIRPKRFFITSQYSIEDIWDDKETQDAIRRRCRVIIFTKDMRNMIKL